MRRHVRVGVVVLGAIAMLGVGARSAHAAPFLLSQDNEEKLETWLGQGDLTFTNIFEKTVGSTSSNFHAAVDGEGPTFTLLQAIYNDTTYIIGGYNPQSWHSGGSYNITGPDAERTAFLYNLTTGTRLAQRLSNDNVYFDGTFDFGQYQTANQITVGPAFGGGFDLVVGGDLIFGGALQFSYGPGGPCGYGGQSVLGVATYGEPCLNYLGNSTNFTVRALEVYTFAPATAAAVPEPATLGLLAVGLVAIGARRRWTQVR